MSDSQPDETRVRWWLIALFAALGAGFIWAGAAVADGVVLALKERQASYWSGVAVNLGSALLLAGAIVWFERVITRRVTRATTLVARQVATEAATVAADTAVREATARIQPKLDEIDRLLDQRAQAWMDEPAEAAATLGEEASREAMMKLMAEATEIRAIEVVRNETEGRIVVPAGEGVNPPRIEVTYTPMHNLFEGATGRISIRGLASAGTAEIEWSDGLDALSFFANLRRSMVREGAGESAKRLSPATFFRNLAYILDAAIKARNRAESAWLSGARVVEMIAIGWAMTATGLEVEGRGTLFRVRQIGGIDGNVWREDTTGEMPEGLDPTLWKRAKWIGEAHFRETPF